MRRKTFTAICSLFALTLLIAPATASSAPAPVYVSGQSLAIGLNEATTFPAIAGDTSPHTINVSYSGGNYVVTDTSGATAGTGCAQAGPTTVSCPDTNLLGVGVYGGGGSDTIKVDSMGPAATGAEVIGFQGDDNITTPATNDAIYGFEGNDTMDAGLGADTMNGGRGSDTVSYANRGPSEPVFVSVTVDEGNPEDTISIPDGAPGENDSVEAENAIGGAGNDTFLSPTKDSTIIQDNGAANTYSGGAGNDRLVGGTGKDLLIGGTGNDKLLGGASKDTMDGGAGKDRCVGGPRKDKAKKCEIKVSI